MVEEFALLWGEEILQRKYVRLKERGFVVLTYPELGEV
jgi:hypothetical protein